MHRRRWRSSKALLHKGIRRLPSSCGPFYGNAGVWRCRTVYAAVRATGGLAIADEVQVGYGRTGRRVVLRGF